MEKTSARYPPSTGYHRPAERKFYVWQDTLIDYRGYSAYADGRWGRHPWRWLCTLCEPPSYGFRARTGAQQAIVAVSLPHHMRVRRSHHEWVRRNRCSTATSAISRSATTR